MSFDYSQDVKELRKNQHNGVLRSTESRLQQLQGIMDFLRDNEKQLYDAVYKDLHKCQHEANMMEVMQTRKDIGEIFQNLDSWVAPVKTSPDIINLTNSCQIRAQAKGVVLVISPWNYPIALLLQPLAVAFAAGNCVIVKPSEMSPHTSKVLADHLPKYLDRKCFRVVTGGVRETTALLREHFDHIFFTGAPAIGKIVMRAASDHLTPVTLELGGKNCAIIDETCNFDTIGQRIAWGKFCNAGQTCLAADYCLVKRGYQDKLAAGIKKAVTKFYGEDPKTSTSYGRIINERHFRRLEKLIDQSKVVFGGKTDQSELYISPTVMRDVARDAPIMEEEIFGPILPMMTYGTIEEAIEFVNEKPQALALYVFTQNTAVSEKVMAETSSGGVTVNDILVHASVPSLPFGGIGESGMGAYHGKKGFEELSHMKSCLIKTQGLEFTNFIRYPPYNPDWRLFQFAEWIIKPSPTRPNTTARRLLLVSMCALLCALVYKWFAIV